jgi:hypothetical protein
MNNGIIYGATVVLDTICQITTSINEVDDNSSFVKAYPNPFNKKLHLNLMIRALQS